MNRFFFLILMMFSFLYCANENANAKHTLKELREIEEFNRQLLVKNCKTEIEKELCKRLWFGEKRDSIFLSDTINISSVKGTGNFIINFHCDNTISLKETTRINKTWWKMKRDTLEIFLDYKDCNSIIDYKSNGSGWVTKNHNVFKIVRIDSLLVLNKIENLFNESYYHISIE